MDNADLNEKFVVAEHFKKNVADDAPVKIAYMSENFEKLILVKIEDIRGLAIPRHHHDLEKESLDCEILNDLGGKDAAEVTVAGIWELLKLQRNGGDGKLHNDGCANLFSMFPT